MSSELDDLRVLNEHLRLVPKGVTVDELERNASAFTHEAAKLLHGFGWRRIRKTEGKNVDGMDIDKLVNVHTFELRDIVISAGAPNATVGWQHVGELRDTSRIIEVRPDVPAPAPAPSPTPAPPAGDDFYRDAIMALVNELGTTNERLDHIAEGIDVLGEILAVAMRVEGPRKP
jgi:hypothetical protein